MADVICIYCKKKVNVRKFKLQRMTDKKGLRFVQYFPEPTQEFPFHAGKCFFLWVYEKLKG